MKLRLPKRRAKYLGQMINPERFHKSQIKFYLILLPILLVMMLPIVFIISHAFKPLDELYAYPPKFFPSRLTLDNFKQLIKATSQTGVPFSRYLFNSILVAILQSYLVCCLAHWQLLLFRF